VFGAALPDNSLDVVLEKHAGGQVGNVGRGRKEIANDVIEALLADPGIDQLGLFMATAASTSMVSSAQAIVDSRNESGKPIYAFSALPPSMTAEGREILRRAGIPVYATPRRMAAVMRVLESWLLFQKGQYRDAARILDQAEAALRNTDDHITLGNFLNDANTTAVTAAGSTTTSAHSRSAAAPT